MNRRLLPILASSLMKQDDAVVGTVVCKVIRRSFCWVKCW